MGVALPSLRTCVLALAILFAAGPALAGPKVVGQPAPPFTLTTYDGEQVTLDQLRGKVVVLNYWATWCAPCRVELPELDTYMRRHRSAGVVVYAVEVSGVPRSKLTRLADVVSFPMVSRLKGKGYGKIRGAVPTNYVIDRAGVIRHADAGAFTAGSLEAIVTPLLREPAPKEAAAAAP
jgi:cytochrome c biogenesis protein CcmG/thiol:disulfide interchange protein DsbE